MTSLFINDLPCTQVLDREAASAVRGGIATFPVEPDGGNGSGPHDIAMPPWAMPAMPAFPLLPGWCGTPQPQEPRVPINRPPTDRHIMR